MADVHCAILAPWNGGMRSLRLRACFGDGVRISECRPTIGAMSSAASPAANSSWFVSTSRFVSRSAAHTMPPG